MNDTKQALEAVVGLVGKAEQGEWHMYGGTNHARVQTDDVIVCDGSAPHFMQPEDARAIAAAVNLIRTHGPALLAALEDARRYRWLRDTLRHDNARWEAVGSWNHSNVASETFDAATDAAIDAMAAGEDAK